MSVLCQSRRGLRTAHRSQAAQLAASSCNNTSHGSRTTRAAGRTYSAAVWAALGLAALAGCVPPGGGNGNDNVEGRVITTIAGTGTAGFAGDGGPATSAQLNAPADVCVRANGQIIIADTGNHRVRSIDPDTGVITTIAGTGEMTGDGALPEPAGVVFDESDGNFYVAAWGGAVVFRYDADGAREIVAGQEAAEGCDDANAGNATAATIQRPRSVALLEDGSLLFSEQGCHRIRQVTPDGNLVSFAGTGTPGYSGDLGLAVEAELAADTTEPAAPNLGIGLSPESPPDELYIADSGNHVIREVNLRNGEIDTFAGTGVAGYLDGPPGQAMFRSPATVVVDPFHEVYVADTGNHAVRRVDSLGTEVSTIAGTGTAGFSGDGGAAAAALLNGPRSLFVTEDGTVYIADTGNHRVRKVTPASP